MSRLIPSREALDEFLLLLKRYSVQFRICLEKDTNLQYNDPHLEPPHQAPAMALQREIGRVYNEADFLAPYGWTDAVMYNLESFRLLDCGYILRFWESRLIETGPNKGRLGRVFNSEKAQTSLERLERFIKNFEAELSAVTVPATGVQRESDRKIVETLREVGRRCTTQKLLSEMTMRKLDPAESTVKKRLAAMVESGLLTKDANAKPPGYGLPEWSRGSSGS